MRFLALTLAIAVSGCAIFRHTNGPPVETITLAVRNQSVFDVDVYALQSSSGSGAAIRLGTVFGNSSQNLKIRATDIQAGGNLALRLHAIGTRSTWISPTVAVSPDIMAKLDIMSDPRGNLNRSVLFTMSTDTLSDVSR